MITLQKKVTYGGALAAAPSSAVDMTFEFPVFKYAIADGDDVQVVRTDTGTVVTSNVSHPLADVEYRLLPGDVVITGREEGADALAWRYYLAALQSGAVADLEIPIEVRFSVGNQAELGRQSLQALCVPRVSALAPGAMLEAARLPKADYVLIQRSGFDTLRKQIANASFDFTDSQVLAAIPLVTAFDGTAPVFTEAQAAALKALLASTGSRATNADTERFIKVMKAAFAGLLDFALVIPEMRLLKLAGTFTVTSDDGRPTEAADFQDFEIVAECLYGMLPVPRLVTRRFSRDVAVVDSATEFTLTAAPPLLRNDVAGPVRITVRGLDGPVWTRDYEATDPGLEDLDIEVTVQQKTPLNEVPTDAEPDQVKKLRGQVLTFKKDCPLKDALVTIQARIGGDPSWHIVGAGTTDASGNFTIPYPYGRYTEARAVVSLAPAEAASIPVKDDPRTSIADDFLYLLLTEPDCAQPASDEDCECHSGDAGNRLPDHADLIGSQAYSQDIGGSCVNLSKPNRTINEYAYQAIVRISDPEVATYTLTRYETGLEAIDVSVLASLNSSVVSLSAAAETSLANATTGYNEMPTVFASHYLVAVRSAVPHVEAIKAAVAAGALPLTLSALATLHTHADSVIAVLRAYKSRAEANDEPVIDGGGMRAVDAASSLKALTELAIDTVGTAVRYELTGGAATRDRKPVALDNPVRWQDAPEPAVPVAGAAGGPGSVFFNRDRLMRIRREAVTTTPSAPAGQPAAILAQAVSVATGHLLHYKAVVKADGYSLGDLIYSLPLAPGQKKQIVVFDSQHSLLGAETQALSQNERLAMGLVSDREITDQLAGSIAESIRGSSTADTRGISAGFGTGGQGYGGAGGGQGGGGGYGGSGSAVIGVAGGWAQSGSNATQDSTRDVAQFFGERLRQSIMQNAEGYRQLNTSIVTTVQEGQRYGVTAEVIANHNHCHALTMMYFEVLRHFAVFQELAAVEECVFVPLLLTRFTTENVGKWRDVLAPALLPMPSDSYLQPHAAVPHAGRQHPLLAAFDADQRLRTHYANVDFPTGAYDEERIQYLKGSVRLRVHLPRPRTRFDRILSFPIAKQLDAAGAGSAAAKYATDMAAYSAKVAVTAGFYSLFQGPPTPPNPEQFEVLGREAIFDAFMRLDANYQSVPPAQCMRITDFKPKTLVIGALGSLTPTIATELDFFAENSDDKAQWTLYSQILGYSSVGAMLNAHFKGNLISEWDSIFEADIAPLVFEKILDALSLDEFSTDFSSAGKYHGGERSMVINVLGRTQKSRNQLPELLRLSVNGATLAGLKPYVTLAVDSVSLAYATRHFNGSLYSGPVGDGDLLDGTTLPIPESPDERRNPRREDRYLAARLIEHLNSNLEYYNKVLWYRLDPDRRYMLLDGFSIQVYDDKGLPVPAPSGLRSLASVVKNEVIAVAGNALVMPVAPGYRVSGAFVSVKKDPTKKAPTLFDHYRPLTPVKPYRISVPSRGVFAEAVQGACNACEKIEPNRLQDWSRFPGDEPTAIAPVTPPTPAITDWRASYRDFAAPIVNVQNAPAAPTPGEGLAGLSELLGRSGVFRDITGLDANQQNVMRTYLSNQENAKAFAEMAKEMAMQQHNTQNSGKILDSIAAAKQSGDLNKQDAGALVKDHLRQQIDGGESKRVELESQQRLAMPSVAKAGVEAINRGEKDVQATVTGPGGLIESVTVKNAALAERVTNPDAPPTEKAYSTVVSLLDRAPSPSGDDFFDALDQLKALSWTDLVSVLARLAQRGPSMDGATYLELFHGRAKDMTPVDDLVMAAVLAQLLAKGGRTLGVSGVDATGRLAGILIRLSPEDQEKVLALMDITGIEAEGTISLLYAAAMSAGIIRTPARPAFDFGDFDKPDKMPYGYYIGTAVHNAIAAFYAAEHPQPGHFVATNTVPIDVIVKKVTELFGLQPDKVDKKLRARRPDIFELSDLHLPPGIVYEIKPWAGGQVAVGEAAMYCAGLQQAGIPAALGEPGFPGTFGAVPAPNGYAIFESPVPGVICYQYLVAPQVEIDARDRAREGERRRVEAEKLMERFPIPGATLAFYIMAAGLLAVLLDGGWVLLLAV